MNIQLIIFLFAMLLNPVGESSLADAEDVILQKAADAIEEAYGVENMRIKLSTRWIPGSLRSLSSADISSVQLLGSVKRYSRFQVSYQEGGWSQKAEVQLQVEMEMKVPTLIERKLRGEELHSADLNMQWVAIDMNRDTPILKMEKLEGLTLRKSLNAGDYIQPEQVGKSFMVKAGEDVEMIFNNDALQIVLRCESRQDGAKGEEIQVFCKETRQKYLTKIIRTGEVQWLQTN